MKPAAIYVLLLCFTANAAFAQLSLLPQLGFDNTNADLRVNDLTTVSPASFQGNFKAALRADYRFKNLHGPYASIGTSPAPVSVRFSDPNMASNFTSARNALQFRLEAGYGYNSKPISLGKKSSFRSVSTQAASTEVVRKTRIAKSSCGSGYMASKAHCSGKKLKQPFSKTQSATLNLRLQPSVGIAYVPGVEENISKTGNSYSYRTGNWNTALVSGLGLAFAKGQRSLFTVNVAYTKGLGNLGVETLEERINGKPSVTTFSSSASAWGLTLGVPINVVKEKKAVKTEYIHKVKKVHYQKSRCGSYKKAQRI